MTNGIENAFRVKEEQRGEAKGYVDVIHYPKLGKTFPSKSISFKRGREFRGYSSMSSDHLHSELTVNNSPKPGFNTNLTKSPQTTIKSYP